MGLYKPHKNLDVLLEAFQSLRANGRIAATLVVAGLQEKDRPGLQQHLDAKGLDAVRLLERLPAARLPALFGGARALIHPALLEGFGLPMVEAQAVGTPVVASRASAMPEVAGEGALYFDPHDADDLARQILAVVEDEALRERLIAQGRRNAERFSWRESAGRVLAVYERVG
jgi:alpha-1,3-rhamnosyl/mannosyltransferase